MSELTDAQKVQDAVARLESPEQRAVRQMETLLQNSLTKDFASQATLTPRTVESITKRTTALIEDLIRTRFGDLADLALERELEVDVQPNDESRGAFQVTVRLGEEKPKLPGK